MYRRMVFGLFILIGITVNAQTIDIKGVVSNSAGQPVGNAIVTLVRPDQDFTG